MFRNSGELNNIQQKYQLINIIINNFWRYEKNKNNFDINILIILCFNWLHNSLYFNFVILKKYLYIYTIFYIVMTNLHFQEFQGNLQHKQ